jgi:hypothetical protein
VIRRHPWLTGALCAVLLAGALWAWRESRRPSIEGVRRALAAAGVAQGTPAPRVLAVLDSLGAEHSDVLRDGRVTANFGESWRVLIMYANVFGAFQFDTTGHLVAQHFEEIASGP